MENQKENTPIDNTELWDLEPMRIQHTGNAPSAAFQSHKRLSIGTKLLLAFAAIAGLIFLWFVSVVFIRLHNRAKYRDSYYVQKEVREYLENRYDEKFVVMFNRGMGPAYNYVQLFAYPQANQDSKHQFEIQGYYNRWGKLDYFDSYVMVKLTDDYEAYIDPIIDEYFDDYKFYLEFHSEWLTNNLPPDTKVEDLWELRANVDYPLPYLDVFFKSSQKEYFTKNTIMEMCKKFAKMGYRGPIYLTCYDEDEYYDKKNNENKRKCPTGEANKRECYSVFINNETDIDF